MGNDYPIISIRIYWWGGVIVDLRNGWVLFISIYYGWGNGEWLSPYYEKNTPIVWSQWNVEIPDKQPWFRLVFSMNGGIINIYERS